MRHLRWALLVLFALLLAPVPLVVTAAPAHACSCAELTPEEIWEGADVVVAGSITDRQGDLQGYDEVSYEVHVASVYKGSVGERLTFLAHADPAACGWTAEVSDAQEILVLHEYEGELHTNVCTMSQASPIPDGYVGTEYPPEGTGGVDPPSGSGGGDRTPFWLGIALGSGVVVLGVGWLVLRRPLR